MLKTNGSTARVMPDGNAPLETLAQRVDEAVLTLHTLDAPAQQAALTLKSAIEAFHKAGLTQIVRRLKADPRGKELLFELVDDPAVYALFVMHGLVRSDLTTRVQQALTTVRPYLQTHGGDVELVEVRGDTAFVRLQGACSGCSMSAVTLRDTVEATLLRQIAELKHLEVLPNDPGPALISIDSLLASIDDQHGWVAGPPASAVAIGTTYCLEIGSDSYLLVNLDNRLSAFRNACAHQGLPLAGGLLDPVAGTLTCPWHGWCYDASSGECLTAPQAQLEPLPLQVREGLIWIRP